MALERLRTDQGTWEKGKCLCGSVNLSWIFLAASGEWVGGDRWGQKARAITITQVTADLGLGWESGKAGPRNQLRVDQGAFGSLYNGKHHCCGQLERFSTALYCS